MKRTFSKEQSEYIKAKAALETVKDIDKACRLRVLQENEFFVEGTANRLLYPDNDYLMSEGAFIDYLKLVHEEHKKAGLNPEHYNKTITYEYEEALRKAEFKLVDWSLEQVEHLPGYKAAIKNIDSLRHEVRVNGAIRKKVVDLAMSLAV